MGKVRDEIAKNILYYRKKAKLSQKSVANHLGVSIPAVSNWENGTNSIDIETLFELCKLLGVSINDMYGGNGNSKSAKSNSDCIIEYTPKEKALIEKYRSNPQMQAAIDKLLGLEVEYTTGFHTKEA